MKNVIANSFSRLLKTVVVATGLAFMGLPAITAEAAPVVAKAERPNDGFRVLAKQGSWSVARNSTIVIVKKDFDDGAKFAIVKNLENKARSLVFVDPNWALPQNQCFKISIDIDGKTYSLQGKAASGTMMVVTDIDAEIINAFGDAKLVRFEMAGSKWSIVPANAVAVTEAALKS